MNKTILKHISIYLVMPLSLIVAAEKKPLPQFTETHANEITPFLNKYCTQCHGDKKQKGKLRLDTLASISTDSLNLNTWLEVLSQIDQGEMPPEDEAQPTADELEGFKNYIINGSKEARKYMERPGQSVLMRRLNNEQYKNTLRDLLKIDL